MIRLDSAVCGDVVFRDIPAMLGNRCPIAGRHGGEADPSHGIDDVGSADPILVGTTDVQAKAAFDPSYVEHRLPRQRPDEPQGCPRPWTPFRPLPPENITNGDVQAKTRCSAKGCHGGERCADGAQKAENSLEGLQQTPAREGAAQ